jgi:hypothetical protein
MLRLVAPASGASRDLWGMGLVLLALLRACPLPLAVAVAPFAPASLLW